MTQMRSELILDQLATLFPNAGCELIYHNLYELLIAVILSAQTTDKRVNMVSKELFKKYPDVNKLAEAKKDDVKEIINSLGLSNNKSEHLVEIALYLKENYRGEIPNQFSDLINLPGVGRKTANVLLVEGFKIPAIPVDTHVLRVTMRLGLVDGDKNPLMAEKILATKIAKEDWIRAHHLFIHFGRYRCKAINPLCESCPFGIICKKETVGEPFLSLY